MKRFIFFLAFVFSTSICFSQSNIDLKTIRGQKKDVAIKTLSDWGIKVKPADETPDYFYAFGTAFQMEVVNGKVNTIWVYFSKDNGDKYPYQVDKNITPFIKIADVIKINGTPDETGMDYSATNPETDGWVKWKLKELQLHCTVTKGKVTMVTLMEPNWYPGK